MLLVHGLMAGRALWAANIQALRAVVTPVVVELYGHGRSPSPTQAAAYRPEAYAATFDALRAELGAERWFLAGHSLGAALVLRYALDHPDHVLGLVFTNSASALADEAWRTKVMATIGAEADRIEATGHRAVVDHRINPTRSRHLVPEVREGLAADVPLLDPHGIAQTMRHTTPDASVRERVHTNRVPCLVIAGVREALFAEPAAYAERTMPYVEVQRIEAGHSPNGERPELYNAAVVDFVRRALT
jgi:2-succinyl-6-hydroxy-2,4-cyclohexadiene-1-carboxylate synthase